MFYRSIGLNSVLPPQANMRSTSLNLFMTVRTDVDDDGLPLRLNSVELWYDENCIYDENPHYAEAVPIGNGTLARGLDGFKLFMQSSAARALTTDCFVADYRRGDPSYTNGVWRRG